MSLTEKRLIKRISEEVIPQREAELLEIAGCPLRYVLDWTYFLGNAVAVEGLEQWGLPTIAQAFRHICGDDVGRAAVSASIQAIRLSQWPAVWPTGTLGDGNLDLLWDWGAERRFTPEQLAEHLSAQL
ncbi:MAG: hypothetical protein HGA45_07385 [Chloroflexales bacterium]|nr:hypothetical protein [Chloroflexales bacterium]